LNPRKATSQRTPSELRDSNLTREQNASEKKTFLFRGGIKVKVKNGGATGKKKDKKRYSKQTGKRKN